MSPRKNRFKSMPANHAVMIAGHKTSVSLGDAFWQALEEIASEHDMSRSELIRAIKFERQHANQSSAIRLFVLGFYHDQISKHDRTQEMLAYAAVPTAKPPPVT